MTNQRELKIKQLFLRKFSYELVHTIKLKLLKQELEKQESERIRKKIAIQKLKQKYSKYLKIEEKLKEEHEEKEVKHKLKEEPKKLPIPLKELPKPKAIKKEPLPYKDTYLLHGEVNFGKIHPYVRDPAINSIECQGPDKNIVIRRGNQSITTRTRLNDKEIDILIHGFSEKARIPLIEGLLRARIQGLMISAVVSNIVSSRFIITKQAPIRLRAPISPQRALRPTRPERTRDRLEAPERQSRLIAPRMMPAPTQKALRPVPEIAPAAPAEQPPLEAPSPEQAAQPKSTRVIPGGPIEER